ncbi:uncharacterized protein TNCV_5130041 [Trichonephila clavipes]|nr:uncharacterized protein TNCV_5130041 [Trichonephila clavipes]
MEKSLEDVKSKRKTLRSLTTKLITKVESIIKDESISYVDKIEDLIDCKEQLFDKQNSLKELNEKIESLIKSEEIEKEVSGSEEYSESIIKWLSRISRFTKENTKILNGNDTDKSLDSSINEGTKLVSDSKFVKLPKLNINKFFWDSVSWLEFWSQFQTAIHENSSLSEVQKCVYLKNLRGGVALNAIKGKLRSIN